MVATEVSNFEMNVFPQQYIYNRKEKENKERFLFPSVYLLTCK